MSLLEGDFEYIMLLRDFVLKMVIFKERDSFIETFKRLHEELLADMMHLFDKAFDMDNATLIDQLMFLVDSNATFKGLKESLKLKFREQAVRKLAAFDNTFRHAIPATHHSSFKVLLQTILSTMERHLTDYVDKVDPVIAFNKFEIENMNNSTYACIAGWLLNIAGPNVQNVIAKSCAQPTEEVKAAHSPIGKTESTPFPTQDQSSSEAEVKAKSRSQPTEEVKAAHSPIGKTESTPLPTQDESSSEAEAKIKSQLEQKQEKLEHALFMKEWREKFQEWKKIRAEIELQNSSKN